MTKTLLYIAKTAAKYITIGLSIATLLLGISTIVYPELMKSIIKQIELIILVIWEWNYLIAFLSACIESMPIIGVVVPGMNVMILVGGFWGKYADHIYPTILCAISGAMLGNYIGYVLGKYFGRNFINTYGEWFGIGRTEADILDGQISRNGAWFVILWKFHNVARAFVPFLAGSSGMPALRFWVYNTIWSVIWAVTIILLGRFFADKYEVILDYFGYVVLGIMLVAFGYMYMFRREKWHEYIAAKQAEIDAKMKNSR